MLCRQSSLPGNMARTNTRSVHDIVFIWWYIVRYCQVLPSWLPYINIIFLLSLNIIWKLEILQQSDPVLSPPLTPTDFLHLFVNNYFGETFYLEKIQQRNHFQRIIRWKKAPVVFAKFEACREYLLQRGIKVLLCDWECWRVVVVVLWPGWSELHWETVEPSSLRTDLMLCLGIPDLLQHVVGSRE